MATHSNSRLSPDQYLELERKAPFRSEYIAGEVFAMAGASEDHNLINTNVVASVRPQLRGTGCSIYANDMKVWIPHFEEYAYPDSILVCAERAFRDDKRDILLNPVVLIEVLSSTTANYDRGEKFHKYQLIPSFTEYLLIAQTEMRIDYYQRLSPQEWHLTVYMAAEDRIRLVSIPVELALREVYADVRLET